MRVRGRALGPLVLGAALAAVTITDARQGTGFQHERDVTTQGKGPHRLGVDVPLLAGASRFRVSGGVGQEGLSDLRLFDRDGNAVPHLLVHPPARAPLWISGRVLPVTPTEKSSGFEADFGSPSDVEAIAVEGLPAPFLKRLRLEGSGDRERWTELTREGTLFDLPAELLEQRELSFRSGAYRYLRVTWNDTNTGRLPLPRAVRARRSVAAAPAATLTTPVSFAPRPSEPGRSRYRLSLPGAGLPIVAIELDVPGAHVFRLASISESRIHGDEARPAELGRAQLKQVVNHGATAGSMAVPIEPPAESELDLLIEDGSNAPLPLGAVTARFAQLPWIYFEAPGRPVIARYGDPRLHPAEYDLEAARDAIDIAAVHEASWADERRLEHAVSEPGSVPLPETGAPLDPASFRFSREIPRAETALVALALDASVLAQSRGPESRFADVRIVDERGRQVPYLVERRDEPLVVEVKIEPAPVPGAGAEPTRNRSTYRVVLPFENLPTARLVLQTPSRVFQRSVSVSVQRAPDRRRRDPWLEVIASAEWRHADQHTAAPALVLPLRPVDTTDLLLTIDEGDNAPLPLEAGRLMLPAYRARFYQPAGSPLRLVYGREDLSPPRYDLALLAPQVMGAAAREVTASAAGNERTSPGATFISPRMFWIVLGAAVLVLLGLMGRLLTRGEHAGPA